MKKIEAIIKPFKLDEVKEALQDIGVQMPTLNSLWLHAPQPDGVLHGIRALNAFAVSRQDFAPARACYPCLLRR